jgi:hypothetical protein
MFQSIYRRLTSQQALSEDESSEAGDVVVPLRTKDDEEDDVIEDVNNAPESPAPIVDKVKDEDGEEEDEEDDEEMDEDECVWTHCRPFNAT